MKRTRKQIEKLTADLVKAVLKPAVRGIKVMALISQEARPCVVEVAVAANEKRSGDLMSRLRQASAWAAAIEQVAGGQGLFGHLDPGTMLAHPDGSVSLVYRWINLSCES